MLTVDENFFPCPVNEGDELFPNGIFVFNITRMLQYVRNNAKEVDFVEMNVSEFHHEFSVIEESHIDSVDVSRPVIIAEISPGKYSLIDGHHRVEKARRKGIGKIMAYKLKPTQHVSFLTSKSAYLSYIEYWNGKLEES